MRNLKNTHKLMIFSEIFKDIKSSIAFVIFLSATKNTLEKYGGKYALISLVIIILVVITVLDIVKWKNTVYSIEDDKIYIKYGVFQIHERSIPHSQVHTADMSSSLLQRLFDSCKIEIDTAGGDKESEISLLLSRDEALRVKNIIFEGHKNKDETKIKEDKNIRKFTSSLKDLFMMATMSSRILVGFSMVFAVFTKVDDIIPTELKDSAEVYVTNTVEGINGTSILKYVIGIIFMLLISWSISIIITLIKYYNFTVVREDEKIKLSYGLFDKKEVTIPVNRIQSLIIIEGLIRKPLGYFSLNIETIGYGKDKGESKMICPIGKRKVLNKFFEDILPEMNITYKLVNSPKKALKGFLLVRLLDDIIIMGIIAIFCPYGYFIFFLAPIVVIWHHNRFKDNGLYYDKDFIVMRYRTLSRETVIIHRECIQSVEKMQNIFQKRKSIATFKVNIAGDVLGKSYKVGYMEEKCINEEMPTMEYNINK